MTGEVTIRTVEGAYSVIDPAIAYSKMILVSRGEYEYDVVLSGTPGNGQVLYENIGKLTFSIAFINPNPANDVSSEIVRVIYKN
jgi:hypothetical protein